MKDEIKEILDKIKKVKEPEMYITPQTGKKLLDYITNLQKENERLKEQLEYLRSNEYLNQVKWERNFNEELVKDLQQRIDKAIEYIKKDYYTIDIGDIVKKDLLEILGDKE